MIAAIGKNRELGKDNKLLWHIPEDMKRFRDLTRGHVVIMGRKTYESIGRLLPNRTNIIITRDKDYKVEGAVITHTFEEAIEVAKERETQGEIYIIGGGQIYDSAIPYADKLYLTIVDKTFVADTFFPEYSEFKKVMSKKESNDETFKYAFLDLER